MQTEVRVEKDRITDARSNVAMVMDYLDRAGLALMEAGEQKAATHVADALAHALSAAEALGLDPFGKKERSESDRRQADRRAVLDRRERDRRDSDLIAECCRRGLLAVGLDR